MNNRDKNQLKTVREILDWTTRAFQQKAFGTPRLDSEILLSMALKKDRLYLYLNLDKPLSEQERNRMRDYVKRRLNNEPVAYITGEKEFYSISFSVLKGVLIPRPETESLIETARQFIQNNAEKRPSILDLCSGSGNIGITLKTLFPDSIVTMVEMDQTAVSNTLLNIKKADSNNVLLLRADIRNLPMDSSAVFDIIISNPPYISSGDMEGLSPQIKLYEKPEALYGGYDGCKFIPHLYATASENLINEGFMIIEFPYKQFDDALMKLKKFAKLEFYDNIRDYGNNIQGFVIKKREE